MIQNLFQPIMLFILTVLIFVMQSMTVEIAERKGLNKFLAGVVGIIPFLTLLVKLILIKTVPLSQLFMMLTYTIPVINLGVFLAVPSKKKITFRRLLKSFNPIEIFLKIFTYSELLLVAVIVIIPIIYILGASFSPISNLPTTIWPDHISWDNFTNLIWGDDVFIKGKTIEVFKENMRNLIWGVDVETTFKNLFKTTERSNFVKWYLNTLGIAVVNMVVGVIFITGAAYVFARFKFKGKKVGLLTILVLQVFPSFMGLVAMFTLFETFGLLGKPLALSILYIGGAVPYNMWVIKGFLQNIPKELDESAMIDGANKLQIFFRIILPLSVPIISFVAVSMFMAPWMDYMLPDLLLNIDTKFSKAADNITIAVGLFGFISGTNSEYTKFAAGSVIIALPITVLYMAFQRYLVEGITAGSTKG